MKTSVELFINAVEGIRVSAPSESNLAHIFSEYVESDFARAVCPDFPLILRLQHPSTGFYLELLSVRIWWWFCRHLLLSLFTLVRLLLYRIRAEKLRSHSHLVSFTQVQVMEKWDSKPKRERYQSSMCGCGGGRTVLAFHSKEWATNTTVSLYLWGLAPGQFYSVQL